MANTTKLKGSQIHVIPDGSTDWFLTDSAVSMFLATGLKLMSITFSPSAANDVLIVRDAGGPSLPGTMTDGGILMYTKVSGDTDQRVVYFNQPRGKHCYPYIDASECTFGTAANVRITFSFA